MNFVKLFEDCHLCPRECGVNRLNGGKTGFCKESHELRVGYVGPHFGEEPPITGKNGSGTIFFTGCSLQCSFCQNYQLSKDGLGKAMDLDELFRRVVEMIEGRHVHNINLVTPDHFFPHAFQLASLLRRQGYHLPLVYNLSGYQSGAMLRIAEDFVDIYLPDFKYGDPTLALKLSKCKDYPKVALEAIAEMVRQKGFLDVPETCSGLATKGVLIRHLMLPGHLENSLDALTTLFLEFGSRLPLSLMSQYHPVLPQQHQDLNRFLTQKEFDTVFAHIMDLGFEHVFVQFLDQTPTAMSKGSPFLPDFCQEQPFSDRLPITHIKHQDG